MSPPPYSGGDICLKTPAFRSKTSRVAKRDDVHSKLLFFVKNKGQWNAKSGPKVADGNVAMRRKKFGTFGVEMRASGRNLSNFAHTHTDTHTRLN